MLLIPCPWCGPRDESEFTCHGDATRTMPPLDGSTGVETWHAFVHLRDNPEGRHRELWHHGFGCERWLVVERDTRNHRIYGTVDAQGEEA